MIFPGIALVFCGRYLQLAPVNGEKIKRENVISCKKKM
jgi:hypothetical protein